MKIALVNACADTELPSGIKAIVAAIQEQVTADWAPKWGRIPPELYIAASANDVTPTDALILFVDQDADVPGALGYHDVNSTGIAFGRVLVQTLRDYGASLSQGSNSISVTTSHEVLELATDPYADWWCDLDDGQAEEPLETCLAGDTLVVLANGERVAIQTLAERGGFFSVRSAHGAARAGHARLTKQDAETVTVKLTDGSSFRCTPDHKIMMSDGSYLDADLLVPGSRLRGQMGPSFSVPGLLDRGSSDTKTLGSNVAGFVRGTKIDDVGFRELGTPVRLPAQVTVPGHSAFGRSVEHVFAVRAEEEMIGTDARPNVASMTDLESVRNGLSGVQFVRKSVSKDGVSINADLSVARAALRADPQPASARLLHLDPEALFDRSFASVVGGESFVRRAVHPMALPVRRAHSFRSKQSSTAGHGTEPHDRVVYSVEESGKCDVYDLTVPKHRNFAIGAGVFVHNCDRVEGDAYEINGISVSNFLLPQAFRMGTGEGPFDQLGKLISRGGMTPGGYQTLRRGGPTGSVAQVFGAMVPDWKKEMKRLLGSRTARRSNV